MDRKNVNGSELHATERYAVAEKIINKNKPKVKRPLGTFDILGLSAMKVEILLEGLTHLKNNVFSNNENLIVEHEACNELYQQLDEALIQAKS